MKERGNKVTAFVIQFFLMSEIENNQTASLTRTNPPYTGFSAGKAQSVVIYSSLDEVTRFVACPKRDTLPIWALRSRLGRGIISGSLYTAKRGTIKEETRFFGKNLVSGSHTHREQWL